MRLYGLVLTVKLKLRFFSDVSNTGQFSINPTLNVFFNHTKEIKELIDKLAPKGE